MKYFSGFSSLIGNITPDKPMDAFKHKILLAMLKAVSILSSLVLIIGLFIELTLPNLSPDQDLWRLIIASSGVLLGTLTIAILDRSISHTAANLIFTLLISAGCFLTDSPEQLANGRSIIALILPVVLAGILLSPRAGLITVAFVSTYMVVVKYSLDKGLANVPAICIIIVVGLLIYYTSSNLERALNQLHQTKQTLQSNEERFRALIESTTDVNAILSRDGTIKYANPAVHRLLGYTVEEMVGQNVFNYIHPEDAGKVIDALGTDVPAEMIGPMMIVRLHHRNGSWVVSESLGKEMYSHPAINGAVINLRDITDRTLAEAALRESEEKFSRAFQLSPLPMTISDSNGRILEINQAFINTMEYQPEEIIGSTPSEVAIFFDPIKNQEAVQILREQGRLKDFEMQTLTHSGKVRDGLFYAEPMQLDGRGLVLTLMNDITERKKMEKDLRESEENYRLLMDTIPIGVIVHQEGLINYINPTGAKLFNAATPQVLIGKPILSLVHPDYQAVVRDRIGAALQDREIAALIYEKLVRVDGTSFDAEVAGLRLILSGKTSVMVMIADITKRKYAEDMLRHSEENFRHLSENTADGIVILTAEGRNLYANPRACELLGYTAEEIAHASLQDLVQKNDLPEVVQRMQDRLAGKIVPPEFELRINRKDGTSFEADINATVTVWQGQNCDLVFFRDITERKQAQEAIKLQNERIQEVSRQLVKVQEQEKRLLASELHDDLGQSLTSLKLMLEFAASTRTTSKQQKTLEDARTLVSELMGKVRNLSLDLRPAMLDDFGLFPALRWLFGRFHDQTGISVNYNNILESEPRFSRTVETAAFRIIQEALTNIARHTEVKEAHVSLEFGKELSIEIMDKGPGFDFANKIKKTAASGGLSGMQERARLLGGKLEIHSQKGHGTRIVAKIPLTGEAQ
jgi:PAS domain S-box-containing protein